MILLLLGAVGVIIGVAVSQDNDDDDVDVDNYYTEEFTYSAKVQINGAYTYGADSLTSATTLSCETLTNNIKDGSSLTEWTSISVESVSMTASAADLLLKCLAKSDMIADGGYQSITFKGWLSLDGVLDTDVLQMLADAAPNASSFTFDQQASLGVTSSLTSDE